MSIIIILNYTNVPSVNFQHSEAALSPINESSKYSQILLAGHHQHLAKLCREARWRVEWS